MSMQYDSKKYLVQKSTSDVMTWKLFPRYWPIVSEIHRWLLDFPHKETMIVFVDIGLYKLLNSRVDDDLRLMTLIWRHCD